MNSAKKLFVATAFTGLLAGAGTLQAADVALKTIKPMQGFSFNVGTKHASTYFLSANGVCKLTLMVAEAHHGDEVPALTAARFQVAIEAGKSARLDTAEGKALEFTCQAGAQTMSVKAADQVAVN
jgi:hypothetical protein